VRGLVLLLAAGCVAQQASGVGRPRAAVMEQVGWLPASVELVDCRPVVDIDHELFHVRARRVLPADGGACDALRLLGSATTTCTVTAPGLGGITVFHGLFDAGALGRCGRASVLHADPAGRFVITSDQDNLSAWLLPVRRLADDPRLQALLAHVPAGAFWSLRVEDFTSEEAGIPSLAKAMWRADDRPDSPRFEAVELATAELARRYAEERRQMAAWEAGRRTTIEVQENLVVVEESADPSFRPQAPEPAASEPQDGRIDPALHAAIGWLPGDTAELSCEAGGGLPDLVDILGSDDPGCANVGPSLICEVRLRDRLRDPFTIFVGAFDPAVLGGCFVTGHPGAIQLGPLLTGVGPEGWSQAVLVDPAGHFVAYRHLREPGDQALLLAVLDPTMQLADLPAARRVLARIGPGTRSWSIILGDATGFFLGVPSVSLVEVGLVRRIEYPSRAAAVTALDAWRRRSPEVTGQVTGVTLEITQ
jgi:hypothetical protein